MMNRLENAARLALENSQPSFLAPEWRLVRNEDITALREALAEQQAAGPVAMRYRFHYPDDGSKPYRTSEWKYTQGPWDKIPGNARDVSALSLHEAPTQQPLTDEQKAVLRECRKKAMKWTAQAGIPECAAFGEVAQDLDWLCGQLGIAENEKGGAA